MGSGTRIAGGGRRGGMIPTGTIGVRTPAGGIVPTTLEVLFDWDPVGGASHYMLEIGTTPGALDIANLATQRPVTVTLNFGVYYWRVRSVTGGIPSDPSIERVVYVPAPG